MNILMVNPKMSVGGAERIMLFLARGFGENADRVHIAADRGGLEEEFRKTGARITNLRLDQNEKKLFPSLGLMRRLRRICSENGIDIIHSHHRWTTFLSAYAAKTLGIPLIFHCHSRIRGKRHLTYWGDGIIAVSEDLRRYLVHEFGIPEKRIRTIPNAVPDPVCLERDVDGEREKIRKYFGEDWKGSLVGTMGRLVEGKGIDVFISAVPLILNKYPECRFLIAGNGEKEEELKALSEKKGVAPKICFLGEKPDPLPVMKLIDVFVLPSYTESSSVSSLEAMSLGKPVVATSVGGVPEIVTHDVNGLLVEPGDPAALAESVLALLEDRGRAERFGLMGRDAVKTKFRVDRMVGDIRAMFAESAGSTRPAGERPS